MDNFEGVLICTDLDGTLLNSERKISKENIEAIERFKQGGGYFTFVTGRMPFNVLEIYDEIKPNAPVGCINGGGLYDFERGDYVYKIPLDGSVMGLIRTVERFMPSIGIRANPFDKTYLFRARESLSTFSVSNRALCYTPDYENVRDSFAKITFGTELESEMAELERILRSHEQGDCFDFIRSEETLFEIMPKGVGKGLALTRLAEHLSAKKTFAVGDYDNDISMLRAADVGIAVSNATEAVKEAVSYVTISNDEHAIARVIFNIERGRYKRRRPN